MKISVIFTGGTIGAVVRDGWMSSDDSAKYILLANYEKKGTDVFFETSSPYTVLSENLSANEMNILLSEIKKELSKDCDGIIVTHGTDTLQYSSVAAEYLFGDSSVPVVFVSSDYPPEDERANAHDNFNCAVEFIRKGGEKGVFVSYKNNNENKVNIHIPSEILSHGECDANLYSISGKPYASFDGEKFEINLNKPKKEIEGCEKYLEDSGILVITSHPGDSFSYSFEGVRAVIMKPYHSATLATANPHLARFCSQAKERNIPVYTVNLDDGIAYDTVKEFANLGITPLPYGTFISAYMKLWGEISKGQDDI